MKQVVHYLVKPEQRIRMHEPARVWPIDHPDTFRVSNRNWVNTSPVVFVDPSTGVFRTFNTEYRPLKEENI